MVQDRTKVTVVSYHIGVEDAVFEASVSSVHLFIIYFNTITNQYDDGLIERCTRVSVFVA